MAREICLRQLAVRPRTRAELAKALAKRDISAEVIAEVLDRYDEVGIIDDAAFARAWVSSRHHGRGLARRALANELRRHGVDADTAGEALDDIDPDTEAATARALVDRKLRTASGEPQAVFRRLVGMLARKGYPPGVAIGAVKDALAAQSAEAAEFADQLDADALAEAEGGTDSLLTALRPPDLSARRRALSTAEVCGDNQVSTANRARGGRESTRMKIGARRTGGRTPEGRCRRPLRMRHLSGRGTGQSVASDMSRRLDERPARDFPTRPLCHSCGELHVRVLCPTSLLLPDHESLTEPVLAT